MESEILKFAVDLGSIGAICFVIYLFIKYVSTQDKLNAEERMQTHQRFCETITKLNETVEKTIVKLFKLKNNEEEEDEDQ